MAVNNDHLIGAVSDADRSLKLRGGRYVPAVPRCACFPLISLLFPLSLDRGCRKTTSLRGYAVFPYPDSVVAAFPLSFGL